MTYLQRQTLCRLFEKALEYHGSEVFITMSSSSIMVTDKDWKWRFRADPDRDGIIRQAWYRRGQKDARPIEVGNVFWTLEHAAQLDSEE